jgi:hypothetical protein
MNKINTSALIKTVLGVITMLLGFVGIALNFILQSRLDYWRSFSDSSNTLYIIARDMWEIVPIIFVFCLLFELIGLYMLYEVYRAE